MHETSNHEISPYFIMPNLMEIPKTVVKSCKYFKTYRVQNTVLGKGSYGVVKTACKDSHKMRSESSSDTTNKRCKYIGKIVTFNLNRFGIENADYVYNIFYAECIISMFAYEHGFGVPVYGYSLCEDGDGEDDGGYRSERGYMSQSGYRSESKYKSDDVNADESKDVDESPAPRGIIIMDKFDGTLEQIKSEVTAHEMIDIINMAANMHRYGILHRDLFSRNVMFKQLDDGKRIFRIIDYGLSIPFESKIPGVFRAIDLLNVISDFTENKDIFTKCVNRIRELVSLNALTTAQEWISTHHDKCLSEYNIIKYIPTHIVADYGPGTADILVWSVRCSKEHDDAIVQMADELDHRVNDRDE